MIPELRARLASKSTNAIWLMPVDYRVVQAVVPAKAGTHLGTKTKVWFQMGPRLRGGDCKGKAYMQDTTLIPRGLIDTKRLRYASTREWGSPASLHVSCCHSGGGRCGRLPG